MKKHLLATVISSLILSACGGGSGGVSTPVAVTPACIAPQVLTNGVCVTPAPTVTPAKLQTSVPTPTYLVGSEELAAFNEFNGFRKMMGLGLVAQNLKLDQAAANHANYIVVNQIFSHTEDPSKPGFTGVNPQDRTQFSGYAGNDGEMLAGTGGQIGVRQLMNTIYHRDGIATQSIIDAGFSLNVGWFKPLVVENGLGVGLGQNNSSDFVTTYPVDLQTDLPLVMSGETPNPFSDIDTTTNDVLTKTTSPVSIYSAFGTTLAVTSFTVTEAAQTAPLDVRLITNANDINKHIGTNVVHIVGKAPFKANTKYSVSFIGNVNGVALVKNWSFTTGASLNIGGGANQ
ncbi:MAG: CAP domain-containing protein [bacterium]|nr:CAP domain-containing protein [bacterium]